MPARTQVVTIEEPRIARRLLGVLADRMDLAHRPRLAGMGVVGRWVGQGVRRHDHLARLELA